MDNIIIRPGRPADAEDFARLAMFTAPEYFGEIFGNDAVSILKRLFGDPKNLFSYSHSYFMEVNGEVAGMTLFYDYDRKNKEVVPFVILLIKLLKFNFLARLGSLLRFSSIFARIQKGDVYSSNTALYPKFRSRGLGEKLFSISEEKARALGSRRVVADVKVGNIKAINLRQKLGYRIDERLPVVRIREKTFEYLKLVKELE